jgi:glycosyltransferase involved in cell wall biosynthesis/2-polyprenyl-3-methyl-5-hydroxy-6-metoxy-1,4-benzoquinol methylase
VSAADDPAQSGVNVVGFFRAEFGQGEAARRVLAALREAGVPFSAITYERVPHRQEHPFETDGEARYPANILCLNAEHLLQFVQDGGAPLLRRRSSAGLWFWEGSTLPRELRPALDLVDEIWVASDFVGRALAAETSKPVLTFPLPVLVPDRQPLARADVGLPDDAFVFLFVFDFFSTLERKNPLGLVDAFTRAFPEPGRPLLYLKSINGDRAPADLRRVQEAIVGRSDIVLSDGYLEGEQLTALTALSDCYVSLHRSEGFGLTIAEAMALGKPAIATAYSGNLAFMDEESSYLVPYSLTSLEHAVGPYPAGTVWADPDLDAAASVLREVFEQPDAARERGEAGRAAVAERQSVTRAAEFVSARVPELQRAAHDRAIRQTPGTRAVDFLSIGPSTSWDAPSRTGWIGSVYRRALRRLLRPYLIRQRELETLLATGLEQVERSLESISDVQKGLVRSDLRRGEQLDALEAGLYAKPYVAAEGEAARGSAYASFEDVFRGSEERVRELLEPYVALLRDHAPVLDVGCGRGELLALLREAGVDARGVDVDEGMVERARSGGLEAELGDGIAFLAARPEQSLGAVTAIHVVEHLPEGELARFYEAAGKALRPGGLLVFETINPHSLSGFKTFWVDPTHRAPIFPEVAHALALIHGFASAEIIYPRGSGDAEADQREATEYALLARAPQRDGS